MLGELINGGGDNKAQLPPLRKKFSGLVDRKILPYNRVYFKSRREVWKQW